MLHVRDCPPGQIIGMMFLGADQYHISLVGKWKALCQFIEGFGGVFPEDTDVVRWIRTHKAHHNLAGFFIQMGGNLAFIARSAVDAAVESEVLVHLLADNIQCGGGRRIIQVDVAFM